MKGAWYFVPALVLALLPIDVAAQGRSGKVKARRRVDPHSAAAAPGIRCSVGNGAAIVAGEMRAPPEPTRRSDAILVTRIPTAIGIAGSARRPSTTGTRTGYEKGLDDARDGRAADPTRHGWYRDADRNYDPEYGSRAQYANLYRDGFRSGYEAGFADGERYGGGDSGRRFPWPF